MKLGPESKFYKINKNTSKNIKNDVMSTDCYVLVTFSIYGHFMEQFAMWILDAYSEKLTFSIKVAFYLTKTGNRTKKSLTQPSHYFFESRCYFFAKNANISKIKKAFTMLQMLHTMIEINIKNRPYYFFNDMINIKNFDPSVLQLNKLSYVSTNINIFHIEYMTMKSLNLKNIDSKNLLYLIFNNVDGYIIEESNGDKYLVLLLQKSLKNTQNFE